jgi:AraC-like DNA-binding protein
MTIAPLDLILLLGSLQGFILGTLLWTNKKGHRLSNRLLAVIIGLLALMSLAVGIPILNGWVSLAVDLLPLFIVMPLGPLLYFYLQSVLDPTFRLGKIERLHFLPIVLDLGAPLMGWTFLTGAWMGIFERSEGRAWGSMMIDYNTYVDIPRWISVTTYVCLSWHLLRQQPLVISGSEFDQQRRRWLWQCVNAFLVFQVIWLLFMIPYVVPGWRDPLMDKLGWYPIYIPIATLIYWLGLRGYLRSRLEVVPPIDRKPVGLSLLPEMVAQVVDSITKAMEVDRLFLDPELTVDKVGQYAQVSPKLISAVLNQHLRKNFNNFINEYRVEEVKRRLLNPAYEHLTLTGIAFDCGFNSQATFQRTFKQLTGVSPGEYASQQKNSSQIGI